MTGKSHFIMLQGSFMKGWMGSGVVKIENCIARSQIDNRLGGGNKLSFGTLEVRQLN